MTEKANEKWLKAVTKRQNFSITESHMP